MSNKKKIPPVSCLWFLEKKQKIYFSRLYCYDFCYFSFFIHVFIFFLLIYIFYTKIYILFVKKVKIGTNFFYSKLLTLKGENEYCVFSRREFVCFCKFFCFLSKTCFVTKRTNKFKRNKRFFSFLARLFLVYFVCKCI